MGIADRLLRMRKQGAKGLQVRGQFKWWCRRPDGSLKWFDVFPNGAAYVGLNYLLDTGFGGGAAITTWYVGLINGSGFSAVSANDTMASHSGWSEWTSYSGGNRPAWGPGAAASGVITNGTLFTYAITATGTLQGMFVTSVAAYSPGNTGTLWATALQTRSITNGDTLSGNYTITLTPSS